MDHQYPLEDKALKLRYDELKKVENLYDRYSRRSRTFLIIGFPMAITVFLLDAFTGYTSVMGMPLMYFAYPCLLPSLYGVWLLRKANKYRLFNELRMFLRFFEAKEELENCLKRPSLPRLYLETSSEKIKSGLMYAEIQLSSSKGSEIAWFETRQFLDRLSSFRDQVERRILANLLKSQPSREELRAICFYLHQFAHVLSRPSTHHREPPTLSMESVVEDMKNDDVLVEREYKPETRLSIIVNFLQTPFLYLRRDYPRTWRILKYIGLFIFSVITVLSFSLTLCFLWSADLRNYLGYVITAIFAFFGTLCYVIEKQR